MVRIPSVSGPVTDSLVTVAVCPEEGFFEPAVDEPVAPEVSVCEAAPPRPDEECGFVPCAAALPAVVEWPAPVWPEACVPVCPVRACPVPG
jgi:hypothetical protein